MMIRAHEDEPVLFAWLHRSEPVPLPRAELCSCVRDELGGLRTALVAAGLLPGDHWTRMQPPRGAASEPPELNYCVLSVRRDGYRIVSQRLEHHGTILHAMGPDGSGITDAGGERLWWARVEDAERSIDRNYPLDTSEHTDEVTQ
jgi:hypothetical protein